MNVPLKAEFAIPVVLFELVMFTISTLEPVLRSCGSSVMILAVFELQDASAIILGFLKSVELESVAPLGLN